MSFFLGFRHRIYTEQFAGLFGEGTDGDELEERDKKPDQKFSEKWGWYSAIRTLAKEDITKFDEIYQKNVMECLAELSYIKEKMDLEIYHQKQNSKKSNSVRSI